jgi:ATP-dependent Clp protease adaptor protein ClpS
MATFPTTEVDEIIEEGTDLETGKDFEAEVVVYNCDCHTYQQVIDLFCRFIPGMNSSKAFELAWRIDHEGSAQVYQGSKKMADNIAEKLAGGGLKVEVR